MNILGDRSSVNNWVISAQACKFTEPLHHPNIQLRDPAKTHMYTHDSTANRLLHYVSSAFQMFMKILNQLERKETYQNGSE